MHKLREQWACLHALITWEHVGNLASIEDVVDVLNKGLVFDLCVSKEEHTGCTINTCLAQHHFKIFTPFCPPIVLRNFNLQLLEGIEAC